MLCCLGERYRAIMALLLKLTFSKKSFRISIRVSNSLDPDQACQFVGPDLGPNCLQRLSADYKSHHWWGKKDECLMINLGQFSPVFLRNMLWVLVRSALMGLFK